MKFLRSLASVACALVVLAAAFGAGYWYRGASTEQNAEVVEDTTEDLKLPGEQEKQTVTKEEVEVQLSEIGELSTYSGEYTVEKAADFVRYVLDDYAIPGTTNTVDLTCTGVVKVGYNVDDIQVKVDNNSRTIYIALPEAKVNDNYIIWDTVQCDETNSILNPIDFAEYQTMIAEIEELGLQQAEENGIYEKAENSMEHTIRNFLSGFEDFEVVFM